MFALLGLTAKSRKETPEGWGVMAPFDFKLSGVVYSNTFEGWSGVFAGDSSMDIVCSGVALSVKCKEVWSEEDAVRGLASAM